MKRASRPGALAPLDAAAPAVPDSPCKGKPAVNRLAKETCMINRFVFRGEYWIYLFAAASIIVVATLLYTLDGPIKVGHWFR